MEPAESLRATLGASWLSLLTSSSTVLPVGLSMIHWICPRSSVEL